MIDSQTCQALRWELVHFGRSSVVSLDECSKKTLVTNGHIRDMKGAKVFKVKTS